MSEGSDVIFVIFISVFATLVLITNSIVIIVIIKSRQLHLPTLWNIAFMAAWDFAFGLFFLVFVVPSKIAGVFVYPDIFGQVSPRLQGFIINIINIIIALVDRYISICWPLHYQRIMSPRRFTCAVTSGFLGNIIRLVLLQFIKNDNLVYNKVLGFFVSEKKTGAFVVVHFGLSTLSIIIGFLIRIRLEMGRLRSNTGREESISTQFTYTMYLSAIVYVVSYLPSAVTLLVEVITEKNHDFMMQIGMTCILSNSLWNVFIYGATWCIVQNHLRIIIADGLVIWSNVGDRFNFLLNEDRLFALGGQADAKGGTNGDIYLGINRVINKPRRLPFFSFWDTKYRGSGLCHAGIKWLDDIDYTTL